MKATNFSHKLDVHQGKIIVEVEYTHYKKLLYIIPIASHKTTKRYIGTGNCWSTYPENAPVSLKEKKVLYKYWMKSCNP